MFKTYVLQSLLNGRYYIGSCQNIEKRLLEHNSGLSKSTKAYIPWKLIYSKAFSTRSEAQQYEYRLKRIKKRKYLEKIISTG